MRRRTVRSSLCAALLLSVACAAASWEPALAQDSATVVPGSEYKISGPLGWLNRWLFGDRYRALWTDSVRVRVMRLRSEQGGLRPLSADTGIRSGFLYLGAAGGARYSFRLSDPPLSPLLAEEMRLGVITGPVQDLASALHPGAPLVTPLLARAAGARDRTSQMGVLAADSTLGALGGAFGDRLGFLQPRVARAGALTTGALIDRLRRGGPERVDALGYLRERLFDVYVGSAEFFPTDALWRTREGAAEWSPDARNRDLAFAHFDGVMASIARAAVPTFLEFGPRYDKSLGETSYFVAVDRQFLTALEWPAWDSVTRAMQRGLTDSAIASAVASMPPAWRSHDGASLDGVLRARRDRLEEAARTMYGMLSREPYLYAPGGVDTVVVWRREPGAVDLEWPGFRRRFLSSETADVVLFLTRSGQVVSVRGGAYGGPLLRVAVGFERARIVDASTALAPTLVVADPGGFAEVDDAHAGARAAISRTAIDAPDITPDASGSAARPADGARYGPLIWLGFFGNLGVLAGGGVQRTGYAHDATPYVSRQTLRAGYATRPNEYAVEYTGDFRFAGGGSSLRLEARRSGIDLLKFYGYGNETVRQQSEEFYSAKEVLYELAPSVAMSLNERDSLAFGVVFKEVNTSQSGERYITLTQPYGYPEYREAGVRASVQHDTRDSPIAPEEGWFLTATGDYFPAVLDAALPFGGLRGALSTYLTPDAERRLTLAVRAGGQKVWGPYPVFEAAYLGGEGTVRGLRAQRYAGDASAFGNLEARVKLAPLPFVVRWDFGVSGIVDAGRVWYDGEHSAIWHVGVGGGVWVLLPDRSFMGVLTLMHAGDTWAVYAGSKFAF